MKAPDTEEPTGTQASLLTTSPGEKPTPPSTKKARRVLKAKVPAARTKSNDQSRPKVVAFRRGTKSAKILALLKRTEGASLKDLLKATGWQPHSVRGFLSGTVTAKMGLKVSSRKAESGERRYALKA